MTIELPQWIPTVLRVVMFLLGASVASAWIGMVVWTYQDMRVRSNDVFAQLLAAVLVAFLGLPGLLVHLILRPRETRADVEERALEVHTLKRLAARPTCPTCHRAIRSDWNICPRCQTRLTTVCAECGAIIQRQWRACPFCGHETMTGSRSAAAFVTSLLRPQRVPEPEPVLVRPGTVSADGDTLAD